MFFRVVIVLLFLKKKLTCQSPIGYYQFEMEMTVFNLHFHHQFTHELIIKLHN